MKPTFPFQSPRPPLPNGIRLHEGNPPVNRAITVREWFRLQRAQQWAEATRTVDIEAIDTIAYLIDFSHSTPPVDYTTLNSLLAWMCTSAVMARREAPDQAARLLTDLLHSLGYWEPGSIQLVRRSEHTPWSGRGPTRPGMDILK